MLLLPVSHANSSVRRIPWVSIGLLGACVIMQIHSCAVMPQLETRAIEIAEEMQQLKSEVIQQHRMLTPPALSPENENFDEFVDELARAGSERKLKRLLADTLDLSDDFEAGKLTQAGDARFARYEALKTELAGLESDLPAMRFGYRPKSGGFLSMLTSIFAHGGWLHLLGNMWFLYLVGCNLEDRWGRWQFLTFYLVAGCIAALAFGASHRELDTPLVGASGAVAGAMGAFMVCFAQTKVRMFYAFFWLRFFWGTFNASAWVMLALWMGEQAVMTLVEISWGAPVAYSAHVGGFLFGALVAGLLRFTGIDSQLDRASEDAADESNGAFREHPLYMEAMALRDRGEDSAAIERLCEFLAQTPSHPGAREMLFDLGFARRDLRLIDLTLPFLIEEYSRTRADEPLTALYRELRRALPFYGLTDQELLRIATAAGHMRESALVVRAVSELMEQHPKSLLQPRAMWIAAEAQAHQGCWDLQRETLTRIVQRFPSHACGSLAREQLTRIATGVV